MSASSQIELLQADQRERWQRGDRVLVETYLEWYPALRKKPERLLDLIYNEIVLRTDAGGTPTFAQYRERFPHLEEELRLIFEVHEVLEVEQLETTNALPDGHPGQCNGQRSNQPAARAQLSDYEILGELGRGGMGVVYKARQKSLNRLVALKMLLAGPHASLVQLTRFRIEAEAVARLQHPNIVQIYAIEEQQGRPCFALELLEGGNLAQRVSGPQPPARAAELVQTLARAIHHAHQRGIVHRDLKPSNVLLTADGTPKITDFGLAKLLDSADGQTPSDAFLGSPNYMAPEQALGQCKDITPAADVYALGAVLYELLTGRPPLQGASMLETLEQVRWKEPVPPRRLQPKVPRDLETICLKCLDKDSRRRYATAEALAEDLRRLLAEEPITARPAGLCRRTLKWARRRPALATLVGVVVICVLVVVVAIVWSSIRESRRLAGLRAEVHTAACAGQQAFADRNWPEARYQLGGALTRIGVEEELADLQGPLEAMHAEAGRQLAEQQARAHADAEYRDFMRLRDDALFHGMDCLAPRWLLTGMDVAANRKAAERCARAALALVGLDVDSGTPWAPAGHFAEGQASEIRAGTHALLLVLADVAAQQVSPTAPSTERSRKVLRILDRAQQVGAPAWACAQRRAFYLEQLGEHEAAHLERNRTANLLATTELDHMASGQEHYRANRLPEAMKEFKKVVAHEPQHFWARCFLGVCNLRLQNWERAWDNLTVCVSQRPDFVWGRLLRGYAHREAGAYAEAALDFRQAETLLAEYPNPAAAYSLCLHRGLLLFREGKLAEAEKDFQEAIRLQPEQYAAYLNLARVYQQQEKQLRPELAASCVSLLGGRSVAEAPLLAVSALASQQLSKRAEATAQLNKVLQLHPPSLVLASYYVERGRDLHKAACHEEAMGACRLALQKQADYPLALGILAQALVELRHFADAERTFTRYLEKGGRLLKDIYRGRGQARMQLGNYLGAVEDYTRVLEQESSAEIRTHRGWAYFIADAWKPTLYDFDKALTLDPNYGDAYTGRGLARVLLGRHREAVHDAEEARRRKLSRPEMMHNLACIFALAAGKVAHDPKDPQIQNLTRRYRKEAVRAIRDTLGLVRPAERVRFWREKILPDSALDPIRNSAEFRQLVQEQGAAR